MNYIARLKQENQEKDAKIEAMKTALNDFAAFLTSPKFQTQEGGERKDWIATGDVQRWISEARNLL